MYLFLKLTNLIANNCIELLLQTSEQNLCEMALIRNAARNGAVCYHNDSKEIFVLLCLLLPQSPSLYSYSLMVAANQRQTWIPASPERPQPLLLIDLFWCPTWWPRRPESRPLAAPSIVEYAKIFLCPKGVSLGGSLGEGCPGRQRLCEGREACCSSPERKHDASFVLGIRDNVFLQGDILRDFGQSKFSTCRINSRSAKLFALLEAPRGVIWPLAYIL